MGSEAELLELTYDIALKRLAGRSFDLIYLDPPYRAPYVKDIFESIASHRLLSDEGVVVYEHATEIAFSLPEGWVSADSRKYGSVTIEVLRRA